MHFIILVLLFLYFCISLNQSVDLTCNNNKIVELPVNIFQSIMNIRRLYMNSNEIKTFEAEWLESLEILAVLLVDLYLVKDFLEEIFQK